MQQDPGSKELRKSDVCRLALWADALVPEHTTCILVEKITSLKSGEYWRVLLEDGTISLLHEGQLEKVVNQ